MLSAWWAAYWWLTYYAGRLRRRRQDKRPAPTFPPNPQNGHPGSCDCGPCAVFWDTDTGTKVWEAWSR